MTPGASWHDGDRSPGFFPRLPADAADGLSLADLYGAATFNLPLIPNVPLVPELSFDAAPPVPVGHTQLPFYPGGGAGAAGVASSVRQCASSSFDGPQEWLPITPFRDANSIPFWNDNQPSHGAQQYQPSMAGEDNGHARENCSRLLLRRRRGRRGVSL
jgi:hypothetical protein